MEEALLRTDRRNFCIVNQGSPRAIVVGISGKPETLIDIPRVKKDRIPVIKRFSGGGTVIVDEQTLFVTFILSKEDFNEVSPFPEPILRWSAEIYKEAWKIPSFQLRENDYAIGEKKCGGNAQYIQKDRFLHHTSFLWDYSPDNMNYLLMPPKRPAYRNDRSHEEFLTPLKTYLPQEEAIAKLKNVKQFYIEDYDIGNQEFKPHRQATQILNL